MTHLKPKILPMELERIKKAVLTRLTVNRVNLSPPDDAGQFKLFSPGQQTLTPQSQCVEDDPTCAILGAGSLASLPYFIFQQPASCSKVGY